MAALSEGKFVHKQIGSFDVSSLLLGRTWRSVHCLLRIARMCLMHFIGSRGLASLPDMQMDK